MNLTSPLAIWLILLVILLVVEGITAGLTTIWFAGGALVAAVAAYLKAGVALQLVLFIAVSVVLLIFTRPIALKYMKQDKVNTNVDSLLGQTAVVTQQIDNLAQTGQIRINDIEWLARTEETGQTIPADTIVRICKVEGVKVIVEPAAK